MLASREGWLQVWASHIASSSSPWRSNTSEAETTAQRKSQEVLPSRPLGSLRGTWEFHSKIQAVHQPQEKLNLSFSCRAFQQQQPLPRGSVYSERFHRNGIKKLFTAWIASQWGDPKSTDGKQDNSSCRGSRIVCGTKWSNNDSEYFKHAMARDTYPNPAGTGSVSELGWDPMAHPGGSGAVSVWSSKGHREKELCHSLRQIINVNLRVGGSAPTRSSWRNLKSWIGPGFVTEQSQITHPPSYEDVQNTSVHCRTGLLLPHRHRMVWYLAQQTLLSREKDTLKFLQYRPCQTHFLVHPAPWDLALERVNWLSSSSSSSSWHIELVTEEEGRLWTLTKSSPSRRGVTQPISPRAFMSEYISH